MTVLERHFPMIYGFFKTGIHPKCRNSLETYNSLEVATIRLIRVQYHIQTIK